MLLFFLRITTKERRVFFLYSLFTSILIGLAFYYNVVIVHKPSYYIVARIHTIIEFSLISILFSLFIKNIVIKKVVIVSIFPYILICIFDYYFSKSPSIAYTPLFIECLFFLVLILYFFYEKLNQELYEPLLSTFSFWIAVAFIINFAGNFVLFTWSKSVTIRDQEFKDNYLLIYASVTILKDILLCYAVTRKDRIKQRIENDLENENINLITPLNNLN